MDYQEAKEHYLNGELRLAIDVARALLCDEPLQDRCEVANLMCVVLTHHRRDQTNAAKYGADAVHWAKDLAPELLATSRHNLAISHCYAGHTERAAVVWRRTSALL